MFRFDQFSALKGALPAAVFAIGLSAASATQAATYVFDRADMESPRTLNIAGIGNAKATPVQFDGYIDGTPDQPFSNLVAFCVDVYHSISLGNFTPDLTYTDTIPLTTDSNFIGAITLSDDQILQIGRLVNYGTNVFYNAPTGSSAANKARFDELASVQGAIWQVVSGRNVTHAPAPGYVDLDPRIDQLAGAGYLAALNLAYGPVRSNIKFLTPFTDYNEYPHKKLTQAFAIAGVPEPATWAMMIGGFAVAGAMLRRSRAQRAAA